MIAVIDNYDSFTYNLVQYFTQLSSEVRVFQNDQVTAEDIASLSPELIVLSPGPGRPQKGGASWEIVNSFAHQIPILGVCLGHQAIIHYFGGNIVKGSQPVHGKVSSMIHDQTGLFAGVSLPTQVTRYHSLVADEKTWPDCLLVTARAEDGTVMGFRHKSLPVTGIQFHPESILTIDGFQMLKNSYEEAIDWRKKQRGGMKHDRTLPAV